jgi:hypothetical protein
MEVKTMSLPAGAFALAHGERFPRLTAITPDRFELWFEDSGKTAELFDAYFRGSKVSARDFYVALHDLRMAINRAKGGAR